MAVRDNIVHHRTKLGLTQRELAEKAGLTQGAIAKYELGINTPSLNALFRLAVALDVDASELLAS